MDNRFKDGQEIKALFWTDFDANVKTYGAYPVEKITVVMENGQMAGVAWFAVWQSGKIIAKYNGALVESIELF